MGLEKSIGKVYTSDSYLNMNSMGYRLREGRWCEIPFINMGLVEGCPRSSSRVAECNKKNAIGLGACYRDLLSKTPSHLCDRVSHYFVYRHFDTLKKFEAPWFLPNYLCGAGLIGRPYRLTFEERQAITWLREEYNRGRSVPTPETDDVFQTYRVVVDSLRKGYGIKGHLAMDYAESSSYGEAFIVQALYHLSSKGIDSLLSPSAVEAERVEALFRAQKRKEIVLGRIFREKSKPKFLTMAARLWSRAMANAKSCAPCDLNTIDPERKNEVLPLVYRKFKISTQDSSMESLTQINFELYLNSTTTQLGDTPAEGQ